MRRLAAACVALRTVEDAAQRGELGDRKKAQGAVNAMALAFFAMGIVLGVIDRETLDLIWVSASVPDGD